jgi:hypothetical protein
LMNTAGNSRFYYTVVVTNSYAIKHSKMCPLKFYD